MHSCGLLVLLCYCHGKHFVVACMCTCMHTPSLPIPLSPADVICSLFLYFLVYILCFNFVTLHFKGTSEFSNIIIIVVIDM